MNIKALTRIVVATLIITSVGPAWCGSARAQGATKILRLSYRMKGKRTCLIFDIEGPRPKRIGPASDSGISVFFSNMATSLSDNSPKGANNAVKEVKFRRGSNFFEVLYRWQNTSVTYGVRAQRGGRYILALYLTPPAIKKAASAISSVSKPTDFIENGVGAIESPVHIKKVHTSELFVSPFSAQARDALANGLKAAATTGQPKPVASVFEEPDAKGLALYAHANKEFQDCSSALVFCASDIIRAYQEALKSAPRSSQAPLAVYRSGLAYYVMGKFRRAEKYFKTVTVQWPDNPVAFRCWIGLGNIDMKKEAYVEAMVAYQSAQRCATEKEDKAAADYVLGKTCHIMGADKEALDLFKDCLDQAPDYYIKNPHVLRYIGEADFSVGDFDDAKKVLLRYVNYQESDPDQGSVLAKIGEIFLKQGQVEAAKKIYSFVHKYYTNTEGDIICRIRSAELMEHTDVKEAIKMYNDLRGRDLSPSLRNIVLLKIAQLELKECNLEQGLELINQAFSAKGDKVALPPEIVSLRETFFADLVRQYYSTGEYDKAIALAQKYRSMFNSLTSPEALEEIAQSYAARKSYFYALQIYDRLLAAQHGKNLDGILLRCAVYALRLRDFTRASHYVRAARSGALQLKKSEILGQLDYRNEQYADAVAALGNVLQQRNQFYLGDPDSYAAYGYSLYQMKKYDDAVPILKKALLRATADNDTRLSVLVALSDCLGEQKKYAKAEEALDTAIRMAKGEKKNELLYKVSKLYLEDGKPEIAAQRLNKMKASKSSFWEAVAEQELNTINMAATNGGSQK